MLKNILKSTKITNYLAFIFFFSGFASLIYQVVWQRLLTLYYGVGSISTTLIVSVYMFGLGFGSLLGGYLADRFNKTQRIHLYFTIELLLGCFGFISLFFIEALGRYTAGSNYILSFFYIFLFLSIPTTLMGMTLPLLIKIFNQFTNDFFKSISFLYFINTIGAALGTIFTSYVIITFFGLDMSVYIAVTINFILASLIFSLKSLPAPIKINTPEQQSTDSINAKNHILKFVYLLVFITGFIAIGYEIVWFRIIGILVKDSPYAFSSILAVYLLGIALGSFYIQKYLSKYQNTNKHNLYFALQFLISLSVAMIILGYFYLTQYSFLKIFTQISFGNDLHPLNVMQPVSSIQDFLLNIYSAIDVFFWPFIFVFIPTLFMGASLPLVSSLALSNHNKEGKTIGQIYFFNIIGNVLGGIITGFVLLPLIGTESTIYAFVVIGFLFGFFIPTPFATYVTLKLRAAFILLLIAVTFMFFPHHGQLFQVMHTDPYGDSDLYFQEGLDSVNLAFHKGENVRNFINGQGHGYRPGYFFYAESIEGLHFAKNTDHILLIGFGAGSIAEIALKLDNVKEVTIVELCPTTIENLKKIDFYKQMFSDKRINLIYDDGRRYLLKTKDMYDVILMDPLRTTTAYSNNLHSHQFFEIANQHLKQDGIIMVGGIANYKILSKTLHKTFPYVRTYEQFCIAAQQPLVKNPTHYNFLLNQLSTNEQQIVLKLIKFIGDQTFIVQTTKDTPINLDLRPSSEYYIRSKLSISRITTD